MAKKRESIPKAIREAGLKEFNHRCAICSGDRPHLHHIDEDPSNSDPMNLIPLCPNHHLIDQHDASNAVPIGKLAFFRRHKHRHILKPQFNPIFRRMAFFDRVTDQATLERLESNARELVGLIQNLALGNFFAAELEKLLKPPPGAYISTISGSPESERQRERFYREREAQYRDQLRQNRESVEILIVEMLDYQVWPDTSGQEKHAR